MEADKRKLDIIAGIAGIVFAVLFVLGAIAPNVPDMDKPANWVTTFSDSGDRTTLIIAAYLWVIAGLAMIVVLAAAWHRFGTREGITGLCMTVAGMAAMVFTAMLLIGGLLTGVIAGNIAFGGSNVPTSGDLLAQITNTGTAFVLLPGGLSAALGLAAVSTVIVREHGPRWLAALGYIAAACCIFGVVFVPMVALPIWMLIASIVLLRGRKTMPVQAPTPAAAT